ncbi:hypothetical protein D3C76_1169460 [compost metagenome]
MARPWKAAPWSTSTATAYPTIHGPRGSNRRASSCWMSTSAPPPASPRALSSCPGRSTRSSITRPMCRAYFRTGMATAPRAIRAPPSGATAPKTSSSISAAAPASAPWARTCRRRYSASSTTGPTPMPNTRTSTATATPTSSTASAASTTTVRSAIAHLASSSPRAPSPTCCSRSPTVSPAAPPSSTPH